MLFQEKTLLLNNAWFPVKIISVKRAIVLLIKEKAKVVNSITFETYSWEHWLNLSPDLNEESIVSDKLNIKVPKIVVLNVYSKSPLIKMRYNRSNIFKRDQNVCQYCGIISSKAKLNIDHIIPKCQGGLSSWENCVVSCFKCNSRKADRTPEQAGIKLIRKPFMPKWYVFNDEIKNCSDWQKFVL